MSRAGTSHSFVAPSFALLRALMHFSLPGSACQRITVSFGVGVFSSCASVRRLPHCNEMLIFTKYFSRYRMRHMLQSNKSISTNCARSFTYVYIFCSHLVKLWIGIHYDFWVASILPSFLSTWTHKSLSSSPRSLSFCLSFIPPVIIDSLMSGYSCASLK